MILVILAHIIIAFFQYPSLIKKSDRKETITFSFFYVVSFILWILYINEVSIPNPLEGMRVIIEDILHLKYPQ